MASNPPGSGTETSHRAFPATGIDAFLSHFIVGIAFASGEKAGELHTFALPAAVQTVARTHPFVHDGAAATSAVSFPIPRGSQLSAKIAEHDFVARPPGFFERGKEQVWLQILNLDARGDTPIGRVRIILGETFKREYPDLFEPSFGAAQALGKSGFPARLFFSPNAIIETPFGAFKTRAGKALVGASIDEFPPVGSFPHLQEPVALDPVETLRKAGTRVAAAAPVAHIVALAHPIDAALLQPPTAAETPFTAVERAIARV